MLELRPKVDWNKGSAVNWILDALDLGHRSDVFPIYLGDDITDEDAFVAMETRCVALLSLSFGTSYIHRYFDRTATIQRRHQLHASLHGKARLYALLHVEEICSFTVAVFRSPDLYQ